MFSAPWHVLRVATGCEEMVTEWLRLYLKAEVRLFKVQVERRIKLRGRNKFRVETNNVPVFPGYLFVRGGRLDLLEQNGKVLGPIRSGQDFAVIRDEDLEAVALDCNDEDVFVPNAQTKAITRGDTFRFLPGSIFGDAVLTVVKVLNNLSVEADVVSKKSGTRRLVTVSAQTISNALMEAH
jgi:transcription antitermination factor NusG